jgi:hypothetical protein
LRAAAGIAYDAVEEYAREAKKADATSLEQKVDRLAAVVEAATITPQQDLS